MANNVQTSRKAVQDTFYRRYGRAIAAWAEVEQAIAFWFLHLSSPEWKQAHLHISVFYSARSFNGSADMLRAAAATETRDPALTEFCLAAMDRSLGYYGFRNQLAHHVSRYVKANNIMVLHRPRDLMPLGSVVSDRELVVATRNFIRLRRIWMNALPAPHSKPSLTLEEATRRIEELPGRADSSELSQRQRGKLLLRALRQGSHKQPPAVPPS